MKRLFWRKAYDREEFRRPPREVACGGEGFLRHHNSIRSTTTRSRITRGLLLAVLATATTAAAHAAPADNLPFLDTLFSDNMVLQRGQSDPVWGWTAPGASVTVTVEGAGIGAKRATGVADANGKWFVKLPPLPVGGPYTLTAAGPDNHVEKRGNVLVGDVWLCSGQSNMEFGVQNLSNAAAEIAAADYSQIRLMRVRKKVALEPQSTVDATWETCTPGNIGADGDWGGFSAVGYFFGRDLYQDLKIPIGLIHSSWGGTPAQAWTSEKALGDKVPDYRPQIAQLAALREAQRGGLSLDERTAAWYKKNDPGAAEGAAWSGTTVDDSAWPTVKTPGTWEEAGIPELAAFDGLLYLRKDVDIPADAAGKELILHMVVDDNDTTWVNGTLVGATAGYNVPRAYKIPANTFKPGRNTITVRVLDTGGGGGIYGPADGPSLEVPGGASISLAGPWRYKIAAPLAKLPAPPQSVDNNQNYATVLYNGMIAPLIPYGIKGAIWYQGESNAGQAYQYRSLLPAMIGDWRSQWREGSFPFLIVQLAGFGAPASQPGDDGWAELREAQALTARNLPNTGIASAIDIGESGDIHPKNKQEVGRRLALVARSLVYGEKVESSGPSYRSMKIDGSKIRLAFDHARGGLVAKGGEPVKAFSIAGADHKWHWADAKIDGDSIVVSSPDVPSPIAVRYAWASYIDTNLYNKDGLPAFPFRTDDWPGVTVNNH